MSGGKGKITVEDSKNTQFKKDDPRINRNGPPKKLVSGLIVDLKSEGYESLTDSQVSEVLALLLNANRDRINELAIDKEQPIYVNIIADRLAKAKDRDITDFVEKLLDRAYGKATSKLQVSGPNGGPLQIVTNLSPERIDQLLNEANGDNTNT